MTNVKSTLAAIATKIHERERDTRANLFEIGALLIEAHQACEHGDWMHWVAEEFDWSDDTARRYMAAHQLATKFRTVRDLKITARTLYELALDEIDNPNLPAMIDALAAASKGKTLSYDGAMNVIGLAEMRAKYGDLPDATLNAVWEILGEVDNEPKDPWEQEAIAALKEAKPKTEKAAEAIINPIRHAPVAALYAPHGELPAMPTDCLETLECVVEEDRAAVLEKLKAAERLDFDKVQAICEDVARKRCAAEYAAKAARDAAEEAAEKTADKAAAAKYGDQISSIAAKYDEAKHDALSKFVAGGNPEGNGSDPDDGAAAMKAAHAALDIDAEPGAAPREDVAKLVRAWVQAGPAVQRQFVRERWDEIARHHKALEANGHAAEDRWQEGDDAR
jgi:hypothetical protein